MSIMTGRHLLLLVLGFATAWAQSSSRKCYFPNGNLASGDVPCTSETYSACCGRTGICMSNGFCMSSGTQPFTLSRGTCTDSNWGSSCPQKCYGSSDNPGGGVTIVLFKITNGVSTYCCGNPVDDNGTISCPNDEDPFTLSDATMLFGVAALANYTEKTTTNASATTGTDSTASSTATSGTAASGATSSCDSSTAAVCPTSNEVAIGAGVGASLGAIAIAALCWGFWERRRAQRQAPGDAASPAAGLAAKPLPSPAEYQPVQPYQNPQQHIYHYGSDQFSGSVSTTPMSSAQQGPSPWHSEMPATGGAVEIMDTSVHSAAYRDTKH